MEWWQLRCHIMGNARSLALALDSHRDRCPLVPQMTKRSALEDAYLQLLLDDAPGSEPGSPMRLSWLASHFRLYTSRLVAFANTPSVDLPTLRNSDLFRAVEVALKHWSTKSKTNQRIYNGDGERLLKH